MTYRVVFSAAAEEDLLRLFDFALERELQREAPDFSVAERAIAAVREGVGLLEHSPFAFRKSGGSPFLRELVISFGNSGYVALYEVVDGNTVVIGAVRHQREDDYH